MTTSQLSRKAIIDLSRVRSDACVSLLMSTVFSGALGRQGEVRFKELLHKAEFALSRDLVREAQVEILLRPAKKILSDTLFWSHQREGLAAYLEGGTIRLYQLAFPVTDRVVVGKQFHVRPLLKTTAQEDFYILILNLDGAQLLQCGEQGLREFVPKGFPESLSEALCLNPSDQPSGSIPEVHHRQSMGMEEDYSKKQLPELLERYQSGLKRGRSAAGLQSCLRAAAAGTVEHLLVAEGVTGSGSLTADSLKISALGPDQPDAEELFERACLDTLRNGGHVNFLSPHSFSNGDQIVAILRYCRTKR